jgi:antitoxin ParD1/3/4
MPTMNVSLPRELAAFVEDEVASGGYSTASEVVRDALRLLRREREQYEQKMAILRRELQIGMDDIEAGRISTRSVEDIARDVLARHRARGGT